MVFRRVSQVIALQREVIIRMLLTVRFMEGGNGHLPVVLRRKCQTASHRFVGSQMFLQIFPCDYLSRGSNLPGRTVNVKGDLRLCGKIGGRRPVQFKPFLFHRYADGGLVPKHIPSGAAHGTGERVIARYIVT